MRGILAKRSHRDKSSQERMHFGKLDEGSHRVPLICLAQVVSGPLNSRIVGVCPPWDCHYHSLSENQVVSGGGVYDGLNKSTDAR
jgi:hypothetical protein